MAIRMIVAALVRAWPEHLARMIAGAALALMITPGIAAAESERSESFSDSVAHTLSPEIAEIADEIDTLRSRLEKLPPFSPGQTGARRGYHSPYFDRPDEPLDIVVDLGTQTQIDAVCLIPVEALMGGRRVTGYGFPPRFRIEASADENFRDPILIADHDAHAFPNPGGFPAWFGTAPVKARFVRLTCLRHWERGEDLWTFALGEMMVLSGDRNLAINAAVRVSKRARSQPTWQRENLVDGRSGLGLPVSSESSKTNGYRSLAAESPDTVKWVEVDLGKPFPIDEVRLIPARPIDWLDESGHGFPLRFRMELQNENGGEWRAVWDRADEDFPNPGESVVTIPCAGRTARRVRLTATRLFSVGGRTDRSILALAEMQVYSGGKNIALGAPVTALDSFHMEKRPLWHREYLVDGFSSQNQLIELPDWLRGLARRGELNRKLERLKTRRDQLTDNLMKGLSVAGLTAGGLLLAALGWVWARGRSRRRQQVARLRTRIASDLHDEIGSNLGGIQLLSELCLEDGADIESMRERVRKIDRISGETAESMRDIVWLISVDSASMAELIARMRTVADSLLDGVDWTFRVEGRPWEGDLKMGFRRNFLLAFKETIHNVARHAAATEVEIVVEILPRDARFRVRDNGAGFDAAAHGPATAGNGLKNLRRRATEAGGEASIDSAPGRGTTVEFSAKK